MKSARRHLASAIFERDRFFCQYCGFDGLAAFRPSGGKKAAMILSLKYCSSL